MRTLNRRITGPSPMPPEVRAAMSQQAISHRSSEFVEVLARTRRALQRLVGSESEPYIVTLSGTGGLEVAATNLLKPGDRVLGVVNGRFGGRFCDIAELVIGAPVERLTFPFGSGADPDELRSALRSDRYDAVLMTHVESSMGVINPLAELAAVVHEESDALVLADCVGSVGTTPVQAKAWGIDALITVSQKGLMSPPGIAIIAVSARGHRAYERRGSPASYYLDLGRIVEAASRDRTPFTPNVPAVFGLDAALALIAAEGTEAVFDRHRRVSSVCQHTISEGGLELFADEGVRSPSMTSVRVHPDTEAPRLKQELEAHDSVLVSLGPPGLADRMVRIGHMGWMNEAEVRAAASCVVAREWELRKSA